MNHLYKSKPPLTCSITLHFRCFRLIVDRRCVARQQNKRNTKPKNARYLPAVKDLYNNGIVSYELVSIQTKSSIGTRSGKLRKSVMSVSPPGLKPVDIQSYIPLYKCPRRERFEHPAFLPSQTLYLAS